MVHLHQEYVEEVDNDEAINGIVLDNVTYKEITHDTQVEDEQNRIPYRDPPIDSSVLISQCVEITLDNECVECTLLHRSLNSNIGSTKEYTVDHDKTLSSRVGKGQ